MYNTVRMLLVAGFFLMATAVLKAQHTNFIYGEVRLKNREKINGIIQWTDGQMLLTDVLTATKNTQPYLKYLNAGQISALNKKNKSGSIDWAFLNLWKDNIPERQLEGICRFGDINLIHNTGDNNLQIYLKNGKKLRLSLKAEKDIVRIVEVFGASSRKIALHDISSIAFTAIKPEDVAWKRSPLYGTVYTLRGSYSGFISWGRTKFVTSRTLYGRHGDDMLAVKFWDIKRIEKKDAGANIIFNSGKILHLENTTDVSKLHEGIAVSSYRLGRVVIPWSEFKSVSFKSASLDKTSLQVFADPSRLMATLHTKSDQSYSGNCTFDLDEEWDCELVEGYYNHLFYQIPLKNVSYIQPLNATHSRVMLKNNQVYILGSTNEVTARNWGTILWGGRTSRNYIDWQDTRRITFRQ